METKKLYEELTQISKHLCLKHINDPYLRIDTDNFEPELINELFEEIEQISQKIERLDDKDVTRKSQLEHQRNKSVEMIYLIAEIKGLISREQSINVALETKKYEEVEQQIMKIVEKFQDMPL